MISWKLIPLAGALALSGCAGAFSDSLKLGTTALVKVPIDSPVAEGHAGGWEFRHALQAPRDAARRGEWYVAWNNRAPLRTSAFSPYWQTIFRRAPEIADAAHAAFGQFPVLIEPDRTFSRVVSKTPPEPDPGKKVTSQYGSGVQLVVNQKLSPAWPDGRRPDPKHPGQFLIDPMWYQDAAHSQLAVARGRFDEPGAGISIGHLDNGLDGRHAAAPMRLQRGDVRANAVGLLEYAQAVSQGKKPAQPLIAPELTGGSHGMGTSGILAGSWVAMDEQKVPGGRLIRYDGWLGGAPFARVVPVRVAPWVFSVSTAELAYAIDYASRVQGCDVITMSHGGAPNQAWVDAVNAAYERGTAMFAAESDFFSLAFNPLRPKGVLLPASPVYPAGFRRVMGVTGVTASQESYARNSLGRLLAAPQAFVQWVSRGSFGADGTSTVLFRPNRRPDPSEIRWQGELRPQPIAAYSPNVPWLSVREVNGRRVADGVDLDGAGTSASTPQVAAAAALWLQQHRGEFSAQEWRDWHKPEAVYQALLKSANRQGRVHPDPYLGAGTLQADAALKVSYAELRHSRRPPGAGDRPAPAGSLWYTKAPNDYFDGARSTVGILGFQSILPVPPEDRIKLDQRPSPHEDRTAALARLYFNLGLLRRWHGGEIPRQGPEEKVFRAAAYEEARRAKP